MTATKGETRTRLLDTALGLFTVHGVEGTSLQMIADALGVTKAAVYYHFRTKDEITEAVAEPAVGDLTGFVDLVIRNRVLVAVLCSDPGVMRAVDRVVHGGENILVRLPSMLLGPDADEATHVAAHVALAGVAMAGGSPALATLDDESLRRHLSDVMRRLVGRPRRR
jgi:AcrR family transcriptional regulator